MTDAAERERLAQWCREQREWWERHGNPEPYAANFAALEDILRAPAVPEGWRLVPTEPTEVMLEAARDWSYAKYGKPVGNDGASGCYAAMLAVAPQPEEPDDGK